MLNAILLEEPFELFFTNKLDPFTSIGNPNHAKTGSITAAKVAD